MAGGRPRVDDQPGRPGRRPGRRLAARRLPRLPDPRRRSAHPAGSRPSRRRTARRWPSTRTCSAGTPTSSATPPSSATRRSGVDQDARAGIMDGSAFLGDEPSRWNVYLQVEDTDETVGEAIEAGGQVSARGRGHAVRPDRGAPGPDRRRVPGHGPEPRGQLRHPGEAGLGGRDERPRARGLELRRQAEQGLLAVGPADQLDRRSAARRRPCPTGTLQAGLPATFHSAA